MANKNRRNHVKGGGTAMLRGAVLGVVALVLVLLYLGIANNCEELGRQIKAAEQEKADLLKQVATEEQNWAQARSFRNMELLMAQYGIQMDWPQEKDIIRLHVAKPDEAVEYAQAR
jgi:hypothetical protein